MRFSTLLRFLLLVMCVGTSAHGSGEETFGDPNAILRRPVTSNSQFQGMDTEQVQVVTSLIGAFGDADLVRYGYKTNALAGRMTDCLIESTENEFKNLVYWKDFHFYWEGKLKAGGAVTMGVGIVGAGVLVILSCQTEPWMLVTAGGVALLGKCVIWLGDLSQTTYGNLKKEIFKHNTQAKQFATLFTTEIRRRHVSAEVQQRVITSIREQEEAQDSSTSWWSGTRRWLSRYFSCCATKKKLRNDEYDIYMEPVVRATAATDSSGEKQKQEMGAHDVPLTCDDDPRAGLRAVSAVPSGDVVLDMKSADKPPDDVPLDESVEQASGVRLRNPLAGTVQNEEN
jgi:hypothetical protein